MKLILVFFIVQMLIFQQIITSSCVDCVQEAFFISLVRPHSLDISCPLPISSFDRLSAVEHRVLKLQMSSFNFYLDGIEKKTNRFYYFQFYQRKYYKFDKFALRLDKLKVSKRFKQFKIVNRMWLEISKWEHLFGISIEMWLPNNL